MVDGAKSGQAIDEINDPVANYWDYVNYKLSAQGLSPSQVQVIWFKEAEKYPTDTSFATYPDALKVKFNSVIQMLKTKFPNLKICYLSDRMYAGYAIAGLNPEPFAWYNGWTIKRLIEDQIKGNPSLRYSGANPPRPGWHGALIAGQMVLYREVTVLPGCHPIMMKKT